MSDEYVLWLIWYEIYVLKNPASLPSFNLFAIPSTCLWNDCGPYIKSFPFEFLDCRRIMRYVKSYLKNHGYAENSHHLILNTCAQKIDEFETDIKQFNLPDCCHMLKCHFDDNPSLRRKKCVILQTIASFISIVFHFRIKEELIPGLVCANPECTRMMWTRSTGASSLVSIPYSVRNHLLSRLRLKLSLPHSSGSELEYWTSLLLFSNKIVNGTTISNVNDGMHFCFGSCCSPQCAYARNLTFKFPIRQYNSSSHDVKLDLRRAYSRNSLLERELADCGSSTQLAVSNNIIRIAMTLDILLLICSEHFTSTCHLGRSARKFPGVTQDWRSKMDQSSLHDMLGSLNVHSYTNLLLERIWMTRNSTNPTLQKLHCNAKLMSWKVCSKLLYTKNKITPF